MSITENYKHALAFALEQNPVKNHIQRREEKGYRPVGINMRRRYSQQHKRPFIQINVDFAKQNENTNLREDIIIWLKWDNQQYYLHDIQHVHEVPDGLS